MPTPINQNTEPSLSIRPITLDGAADFAAELNMVTRTEFQDFTTISGHDSQGRKVILIMGHMAGDAAVISSDRLDLALAA